MLGHSLAQGLVILTLGFKLRKSQELQIGLKIVNEALAVMQDESCITALARLPKS